MRGNGVRVAAAHAAAVSLETAVRGEYCSQTVLAAPPRHRIAAEAALPASDVFAVTSTKSCIGRGSSDGVTAETEVMTCRGASDAFDDANTSRMTPEGVLSARRETCTPQPFVVALQSASFRQPGRCDITQNRPELSCARTHASRMRTRDEPYRVVGDGPTATAAAVATCEERRKTKRARQDLCA